MLFVFSTSTTPTLIHNIGLGLISIFLTAIIFIYTAAKEGMQDWDRAVILEKVVNVKDFLIYLSFLFIPPFFWEYGKGVQITILIMAVVGICYLVCQLKNIYFWTSDLEGNHGLPHLPGYRQKLREQFLSEAKDQKRARIWAMTWGKSDTEPSTETRLQEIFFKQIVEMADNNDWLSLRDYLQTFNANRTKREIKYWHSTRVAFESLLKISFKEYEAMYNASQSGNHDYINCGHLIDELLSFYLSTSLKSGAGFIIFDSLKQHLADKDERYTRYFVSKIFKDLFESIIDSGNSYSLWDHNFPEEWKVTENNLRESVVARSMFYEYVEWLQNRIRFDEEWDKHLDGVSRELFPETHPSWWAELMTYAVRPWGDSRIKSLFENKPNFGFIGRSLGGVNISMEDLERQMTESIQREQRETVDFYVRHFPINIDDLNSAVETLEGISPVDEREEHRKSKLIELFKAVLEAKNRLSGGDQGSLPA